MSQKSPTHAERLVGPNGTKIVISGAGVPPAFPWQEGSRDGRPTSKNSPNLVPFARRADVSSAFMQQAREKEAVV